MGDFTESDWERLDTVLIEELPIGLVAFDRNLKVIRWNRRMTQLSGIPDEEVMGHRVDACWSVLRDVGACEIPEHLSVIKRATSRHGGLAEGQGSGEGGGRTFELSCRALTDRDGQNRGGICMVTVEDKTEAIGPGQTERYRLLVENSSDLMMQLTASGEIIYVSPNVGSILGYEPRELVGTNVFEAMHPYDRTQIEAQWPQEEGKVRLRYPHRDGTWRWLECTGKAYTTPENGEQVAVISRDVTDQVLAEEARRRDQEQIRQQAALLDLASDAIVVKDMDDRIIYVNKRFESMTGWSAQKAVGCSVREVLQVNEADYQAAWGKLFKNGEWRGELRHLTGEGVVRVADERWTLVRNSNGSPVSVLAIKTDITEQKAAEQRYLCFQRLKSVGTLANGIAHDLNNILAPIVMSAELIRKMGPSEKALYYLSKIEDAAARATNVIQQVLTFSRGDEGSQETVNIRPLLDDLASLVRESIPKEIEVKVEVVDDTAPVYGDPTQLHQVLMNLCVNARDAMPQGGELTITAQEVDVAEEAFPQLASTIERGRYVRIEVKDTGEGIAERIRHKVFEPFFTSKEPGKGTGLGLSAALGIVQSHGGFMDLESEEGQGTRITNLFAGRRRGGIRFME